MKKYHFIVLVILLITLLSACGSSKCSIENCENNMYVEGLCEEHHTEETDLSQKSDVESVEENVPISYELRKSDEKIYKDKFYEDVKYGSSMASLETLGNMQISVDKDAYIQVVNQVEDEESDLKCLIYYKIKCHDVGSDENYITTYTLAVTNDEPTMRVFYTEEDMDCSNILAVFDSVGFIDGIFEYNEYTIIKVPDSWLESTTNNASQTNNQSSSTVKEENNGSSQSINGYSGSYDAVIKDGSGSVLIFASEEAMDRYGRALANNNKGTQEEMLLSGEVALTEKNTKCNIIERKITKIKVKLLDGTYAGNVAWTYSESVHEK